jgi:hypothetical protein
VAIALTVAPGGATLAQQPVVTTAASLRISNAAMGHILELHGPDSKYTQPSSKYAPGTTEQTIRALIAETLSKSKASGSTENQGGTRYDYSFPQPIGTTMAGEPTTSLSVVLDGSGDITTAFRTDLGNMPGAQPGLSPTAIHLDRSFDIRTRGGVL